MRGDLFFSGLNIFLVICLSSYLLFVYSPNPTSFVNDLIYSPIVQMGNNLFLLGDEVLLDSKERILMVNEYYSLGEFENITLSENTLMLDKDLFGNYYSSGSWVSPVFNTQNEYVLWDWVYANVDFVGMQENLLEFGNISSCGEPPKACGMYYSDNLQGPYIEDLEGNGDLSMRITPNTSQIYDNYYAGIPVSNYVEVDSNKPLHVLFDFKFDTDGSPIEFWLGLANSTSSIYTGRIMSYDFPIYDFEEQYFAIRFSQIVNQTVEKAGIRFFSYFRAEDYPNKTAWVDNIKMFQDSPISFQVRTSLDGLEWSDWTDERYFVSKRTAPGGKPGKYIQFKIDMKRNLEVMETPKLDNLHLDYSKAFPFDITWDYNGPSVFDEPLINVSEKGFVDVNSEGNIVFEDDSLGKFWALQMDGEQYTSNFETICKKVRQMGFNMIKMTYYPHPSTFVDSLIDACKDEGVYLYVQLGGVIDSSLFLEDLFGNNGVNSYYDGMISQNSISGIPYYQEPLFVFSQLFNEVRAFSRWSAGGIWTEPTGKTYYLYQEDYDAYLRGELVEEENSYFGEFYQKDYDSELANGVHVNLAPAAKNLWWQFLSERYENFEALNDSWYYGRGDNENFVFYNDESENNFPTNIKITRFDDWKNISDKRFSDSVEFFSWLYNRWYTASMTKLRDELDIGALVVPNNHYYGLPELKERTITEVMDQHPYFASKRYNSNLIGEFVTQLPQSKSPFSNMVSYTSLNDVKGYPVTMSESNHNVPNLFTSEMPLFISSYGSYHDWDAWFLFKTHSIDYRYSSQRIFNHYDSWYAPERMAFMPIASRIFRYNYVTPGTEIIELNHSSDTVYNYKLNRGYGNKDYNIPGMYTDLPLVYRVQRENFDAEEDKTWQQYYEEFSIQTFDKIYETPNQQLYLDSDKGYFVVDAQKVQGFSGFTQESVIELQALSLFIPPKGNNFSTIALIPLDDLEIINSKSLLLSAAGRSESSNIQWTADKKGYYDEQGHYPLVHWGEPPVLVEGISAQMSLKTNSETAIINILNPDGQRTGRVVPSKIEEGVLYFNISDEYETLWYEILFDSSLLFSQQNVSLKSGWNLVFLNLTGDFYSSDFDSLVVMAYQDGNWIMNFNGNNDFELNRLQGYYVYSNTNKDVLFEGIQLNESDKYEFQEEGWNLFSVISLNTLVSLYPEIEGTSLSIYEVGVDENIQQIDYNDLLMPGSFYWVNLDGPNLSPPKLNPILYGLSGLFKYF